MQKYQSTALKSIILKIYVFLIIGFAFGACNPVKHIPEDAVYLKKNKIQIPRTIIEKDALYPFIKQKANSKTLWIVKYKMQQYLSFNQESVDLKNQNKKNKLEDKNHKREAKNKDPVEFKDVWSYRQKEAGEEPVIFKERAVKQTIAQFEKALFNIGYFHSEVSAKYNFNRDSNKVVVTYLANTGPRFTLNKISLVINDNDLLEAVKKANKESLLHSGDPYQTEIIEKERQRFSTEMRNQGYYFFNREYIEFEIDSTIDGDQVNIKTIIKNPAETNYTNNERTSLPHLKYKIGQITLNTSFDSKYPDEPEDSIHFEKLIFINLSRLKYNPHAFVNKLFFKSGEYYSQEKEEKTYSRISGLNNFSYINIGFSPDETDSTTMNCNIQMSPLPSQTVGVELEGTNTGQNLGVSGYLTYSHKNLFGSAEELITRIKGGFESQYTDYEYESNGLFGTNTTEYGFETSLIFQNLLVWPSLSHKILQRFNRPKTSLNFIFNDQKRPDFTRRLTNLSLAYFFTRKQENTTEYAFYPIDISYVLMNNSEAFNQRLEEENNPLLKSTYSSQFIVGSRALETWTNRKTVNQKSFILNKTQADIAGNLLYLFDNLLNNTTSDSGNYYEVLGVRYAQFVRVQNDWRFTQRINSNHSIAYRAMGGIGFAYGNSEVLPYERSFYGGGANDNRGWIARTLGPGSYSDTEKAGIDQVGDIKIQLSAEYRFTIVKSIEGAFFTDVGNIWLRQRDSNRPNAEWKIDRFLSEMAIGAGPGLRLNFGFLLVRFDWGFKIYNPGNPVNYRWFGGGEENVWEYGAGGTFNLGIGYPF
ncbi:MAG: BamA/TamA family outer membrane protein [Salibacteraceae bacterium]